MISQLLADGNISDSNDIVAERVLRETACWVARVVEERTLVVVLLLEIGVREGVEVVIDHVGERAYEVVEVRMLLDDGQQLIARVRAVLLAALAVPHSFAFRDRLEREQTALGASVAVFLATHFDLLQKHHLTTFILSLLFFLL